MKTINSLRSKLFALTLALMASVASFAYEFEYVNDFHIDGFAYSINSASANNDSAPPDPNSHPPGTPGQFMELMGCRKSRGAEPAS